ncbi:uncharacterized protein M6B38_378840 [Iris pallida]|uniref:Uncharacterized protein n=1 Tax=Iris pallida TaxID=29817 RepID=A0AAX6G911_IRIPA|nr:uncharacterized protein M6B38_378840 [Iris pallida]
MSATRNFAGMRRRALRLYRSGRAALHLRATAVPGALRWSPPSARGSRRRGEGSRARPLGAAGSRRSSAREGKIGGRSPRQCAGGSCEGRGCGRWWARACGGVLVWRGAAVLVFDGRRPRVLPMRRCGQWA